MWSSHLRTFPAFKCEVHISRMWNPLATLIFGERTKREILEHSHNSVFFIFYFLFLSQASHFLVKLVILQNRVLYFQENATTKFVVCIFYFLFSFLKCSLLTPEVLFIALLKDETSTPLENMARIPGHNECQESQSQRPWHTIYDTTFNRPQPQFLLLINNNAQKERSGIGAWAWL